MQIITKADLTAQNLVRFSPNIRDEEINPAIVAAQDYDLEPRLGDALVSALGALPPVPEDPDPDPAPELREFRNKYVARYLVLKSYERFIAQHGINITQFGVSKTGDPQNTFTQADSSDRAIILKQVRSDAEVALSRLTRALEAAEWTFDGVLYAAQEKLNRRETPLRAPKLPRKKYYRGGDDDIWITR
jgi:hypothetical protein